MELKGKINLTRMRKSIINSKFKVMENIQMEMKPQYN